MFVGIFCSVIGIPLIKRLWNVFGSMGGILQQVGTKKYGILPGFAFSKGFVPLSEVNMI
jgi:hypothetical protein